MHGHAGGDLSHLPARYQNSSILYWVSSQPEDIDGFDFVGGDQARALPGQGFSYVAFKSDVLGRFFARARTQARTPRGWIRVDFCWE